MKNSENKIDKHKIIDELVKMRIIDMASTKTLLDYLMNDLQYGQTYSYRLIGECKKRISEIFKEEHIDSFESAKARLEHMIEISKSEKIKLDAIKEMNKLLGLHKPQRIDVTSGGDKLDNQIKIIFVDGDKGDISPEETSEK